MRIVSWNINSIRIRLDLLQKLVFEHNPDIICLQETKVEDQSFPLKTIKKLGFDYVEFSGEKSYNGVAILSKIPLNEINKINVLDFNHKRHIGAAFLDIKLHNFYIPAGGDIPDTTLNPKFDFKLKFLDWMHDFFVGNHSQDDKLIILGDMNIAPLPNDVWSHKQLLSIVSHTPIEVEKITRVQKSLNFVDAHRFLTPEPEKLYSWWSYRGKDPFASNRGRRLDHIWVSPNLTNHIKSAQILSDFRILERPSDHVPIMLDLHNLS